MTVLKTYRIPEDNFGVLQARIAKLARKCKRNKIQAPALVVLGLEEVRYKNDTGFDRVRLVYTVTLESVERPKIDGFEFAAVISPVTDEDGKFLGNVLRMVPGFAGQLPARYREATNHCDHCNTDRRRLETFVVCNENGFKQVGRNCLAAYLGMTNPHQLATIAEILIDMDEIASDSERDGFGGGHVAERVPIEDVIQTAASVIRLYGWLSDASAREHEKQSTADRVRGWMFGNSKDREQWDPKVVIEPADIVLAAETEEWLETLAEATDDYKRNLYLLSKSSSITGKNFGLVVSAINAYSREMEREIRRNKRIEDDKNSQYVGAVGDRMTFNTLTVLYTTKFESQFGVTHFYKMKSEGNVVVYFSSRDMGWAQGEEIPVLTASVKKHELREEIRQTVITRAALPKPPKEPLTPEQKIAKKAIAKLNRVLRTLPAGSVWTEAPSGDRQARDTIGSLIWEIRQENPNANS